ncbi:T9SS type A sorting domain-containing protein [Flavobacterium psychrotrophum]|uniref:T9SS type A sorting domain-containing protein n=1 Tax=Flavobacterium psychrotrophum TaxID=2294119 RepID=UPI000E30D75F|nr:T9SS type A sorting domain-containing protein [Flavobacterium psychrotrophum]
MRTIITGLLVSASAFCQSYAPAAGMPGSTAVASNSPQITGWATGITVTRGPVNIANPDFMAGGSNFATSGQPDAALGSVTGNSVSLGDGGQATLSFGTPITNEAGFDFVVFENGASDYLELAFVEASSDGIHFFRFPAHSQTQTGIQLGTFGSPLPEYLNNLAGKYGGRFGTPFNLSDLPDDLLLDKESITHIRIIDVVGSIDPAYASYDQYGNAVNDSFPTPFVSCGFDLQGIGVINQKTLDTAHNTLHQFMVYPNPATDYINVLAEDNYSITAYNTQGSIVLNKENSNAQRVDIAMLPSGFYLFVIRSGNREASYRIVKQ